MDWDKSADGRQRSRAKYARGVTEEGAPVPKEKSLQIYETNYHSYAVGLSCEENEAGDEHKRDYVVFMR